MEYELVINRKPPPTLNQIKDMHWGTRRRLKEMWQQEVAVAAMNVGRPKFIQTEVQIVLFYDRLKGSGQFIGAAGQFILDGPVCRRCPMTI